MGNSFAPPRPWARFSCFALALALPLLAACATGMKHERKVVLPK